MTQNKTGLLSIANFGRGLKVSEEVLFFGLQSTQYRISGLAVIGNEAKYYETIQDILIRDNLLPQEFVKNSFDITLFDEWKKDVALEFFNPLKEANISSSWQTFPATRYTIARNVDTQDYYSYLYQSGLYLDFDFACDEDVTDVTLSISLSQEYVDYTYNPDNFIILLNNTPISYSEISLTDVPYADDNHADCLNFQYFLIGSNLSLQKGANNIRVYIADSVPIEGTTMKAHAPIVDAIKLNTSAVLIWDGGKDLPIKYT